jgi:hypothetical protein
MNRLFALLLLIAALVPPLVAESVSVSVGMPAADLLKLNGAPQSKAVMGKKSIYRWPDVQVTLVDGKVESFQFRNSAAEKEDAKERARAEARKRTEADAKARERVQDSREATTYSRLDTISTSRAAEEKLRRAASLQQEIRSIERQLADDDKRSSFKGTPPMSSEARAYLNLSLDNMRSELANMR